MEKRVLRHADLTFRQMPEHRSHRTEIIVALLEQQIHMYYFRRSHFSKVPNNGYSELYKIPVAFYFLFNMYQKLPFMWAWQIDALCRRIVSEPLDGGGHFACGQLRTAPQVFHRVAEPVFLTPLKKVFVAQAFEYVQLHLLHAVAGLHREPAEEQVEIPVLA